MAAEGGGVEDARDRLEALEDFGAESGRGGRWTAGEVRGWREGCGRLDRVLRELEAREGRVRSLCDTPRAWREWAASAQGLSWMERHARRAVEALQHLEPALGWEARPAQVRPVRALVEAGEDGRVRARVVDPELGRTLEHAHAVAWGSPLHLWAREGVERVDGWQGAEGTEIEPTPHEAWRREALRAGVAPARMAALARDGEVARAVEGAAPPDDDAAWEEADELAAKIGEGCLANEGRRRLAASPLLGRPGMEGVAASVERRCAAHRAVDRLRLAGCMAKQRAWSLCAEALGEGRARAEAACRAQDWEAARGSDRMVAGMFLGEELLAAQVLAAGDGAAGAVEQSHAYLIPQPPGVVTPSGRARGGRGAPPGQPPWGYSNL